MSSQFSKSKIDKQLFFSQDSDSPNMMQFETIRRDNEPLIKNDLAISSHFFLFPTGMTVAQFLVSDDQAAKDRMDLLLELNRVRAEYGHIMMDLEEICDTNKFRNYYRDKSFNSELFFEKIRVRTDYLRELFPEKIIGIYGYNQGNSTDTYSSFFEQSNFINIGMKMGVYDKIDVLWSVVYQRFGPTDANYIKNRLARETSGALRRALEYRKSDGSKFKVGALYNQVVANSPSATNHVREVQSEKVKQQREQVRDEFKGVEILEATWNKNGDKAGRKWLEEISIGTDMKF